MHFCVLKEYESVVSTAWGLVPVKMLSYIPLVALESVQARNAVESKARTEEFFLIAGDAGRFKNPQSETKKYAGIEDDDNSLPSVSSKRSSILGFNLPGLGSTQRSGGLAPGETISREIRLKAPDEKSRRAWVTLLQVSKNAAVDAVLDD